MTMDNAETGTKHIHRIHRCLRVIRGSMAFRLTLMPRPDYGKGNFLSLIEEADNRFIIRYGQ
jgi:hypothetical protein